MPGTEGKDGIVVKASRRNMSGFLFEFRNGFCFGTVEFALGKVPLPTKINDGDLDGDLYHGIWEMI